MTLDWQLTDEIARRQRFAVGGNEVLIRGGDDDRRRPAGGDHQHR